MPDTEVTLAAFDKIEQWLARWAHDAPLPPSTRLTPRYRYRLICLQIIICDVKEAEQLCSEDMLWNTTNLVTKTYRKVIQTLQGSSLAVTKRKVEKAYAHSLTTAQEFYRAYLLRICSAYKSKEMARNKELDRMCRGPDKQEGSIPPTIPPGNPDVQAFVDKSFPKTLIFLGDLSRYRTLLRPRNRSFNTALTYYSLANELMPNSGYGFHQSGVIYSEEGDHLQIVYNMYRAAIAVEQPHPLAQTNLEREFRTLRDQAPTATKGSMEAMVSWFVKLHAFYYKGEEFLGQKELENEVDNRLAMSLRKGLETDVHSFVLKMALINISAYVFGLQRTQGMVHKRQLYAACADNISGLGPGEITLLPVHPAAEHPHHQYHRSRAQGRTRRCRPERHVPDIGHRDGQISAEVPSGHLPDPARVSHLHDLAGVLQQGPHGIPILPGAPVCGNVPDFGTDADLVA